MITDRFKTSLVFLFTGAALIGIGVLEAQEFINGLSNPSIIKIFLLIIITAGINETFDLVSILNNLFRGVKSPQGFIVRMGTAVAGLSAFMNNTPVVNVMIPFVYQWGKSRNIAPSKLLMPLSFAAIMGGVITLIGTSTNLLLNGLIVDAGLQPLGFFDFTAPGLAITVVGIIVLALLAPLLLKDRDEHIQDVASNHRQYLIETRLKPNANIIGKTIEEAGLRNLEGIYLTEIIRGKRDFAPVPPTFILEKDDVLLFAGDTRHINSITNKLEGLELSKTTEFNLTDNTSYVEAIVAQNSQLDRKNAKESGFRQKYDGAIIGIHRRGEKLSGKIGSIDLRVGDVLLMVAGPRFVELSSKSGDFIILQEHQNYKTLPSLSKWVFWLVTALGIALNIGSYINFMELLLLILAVQVATKMVYLNLIKRVLSLDLLIILLVSLSLGDALIKSGGANLITDSLFANASSWSAFGIVSIVFFTSLLLTSFVTNVAAVSIIFPIAYSLALSTGISFNAIFLSAAFGASCSFITPFAYQTNLMVMELGKYKFNDFFKFGFVISIVYAGIFLTYIKLFYL